MANSGLCWFKEQRPNLDFLFDYVAFLYPQDPRVSRDTQVAVSVSVLPVHLPLTLSTGLSGLDIAGFDKKRTFLIWYVWQALIWRSMLWRALIWQSMLGMAVFDKIRTLAALIWRSMLNLAVLAID